MERGVPLHLVQYQHRDVVQAVVLRVGRDENGRVKPRMKQVEGPPSAREAFASKWRKFGLAEWRIDAYWEETERGKKAHSKG